MVSINKDILKKPDFFVVGAAKSGTTSLYYYLKQHPDIYLPPVKEPVFFASDIVEYAHKCKTHIRTFNQRKYFNKKYLSEKHIIYIKKYEYYKKLYQNVDQKFVAGDMSALYLFSKVAAENIKRFNPNAKIIILIRNPVDRAFSQFLMRLRDGEIKEKDFLKEVIIDFKKDDENCKAFYIEQGFYFNQIKRYLDIFGDKNVKIFLFEELITTPKKVLSEIFYFLSISNFLVDYSKIMNKSYIPRFSSFNKILKNFKKKIQTFMTIKTPPQLKNIYYKIFMEKNRPIISYYERKYLLDFFKNDIKKTANLIKKDLSHWLL